MVTGLLATPEYVRASLAHSPADTSKATGEPRARRTAAQAPADGLALGLSRYAETVGSPAR
ncbi:MULTISPECIES: hypothetical protein [unclassified Streptomyces]|uniref:hypothetical protein n=1 Tax=unclassified Streptomyces TaxID=2593676 RepID=UPI0038666FAA